MQQNSSLIIVRVNRGVMDPLSNLANICLGMNKDYNVIIPFQSTLLKVLGTLLNVGIYLHIFVGNS